MRGSFDFGRRAAFAAAIFLGACSSDDPDLPAGWEDAQPVTDLIQQDCNGSPLEAANEGATFLPGDGRLDVQYDEAHFRCEQDVEGFYKNWGATLDILVQPVDMHPSSVTRCDCRYDITFAVEPLAAGSRQVTLFRRWDDLNEPNEPVEIASEPVDVN